MGISVKKLAAVDDLQLSPSQQGRRPTRRRI